MIPPWQTMRLLINPFRPKPQFPEWVFENIFEYFPAAFRRNSLMFL